MTTNNMTTNKETVSIPRILIGATGSGCGKTTTVCGILKALVNRKLNPVSFKCGPDYIDPMFHSEVLGIKSRNLDLFFNDEETIHYLMQRNSQGRDLAVMEGVMGYYDGLGAVTAEASSWDLAVKTKTPAILLVDAKGKSFSILAEIKGFLSLKANSQIKGVILNRISPMLYPALKRAIEDELPVKALGYLPAMPDCSLESRHLGLVTAKEVKNLLEILNRLAVQVEESIDLDGILALAETAEPLPKQPSPLFTAATQEERAAQKAEAGGNPRRVRVAVAQDKAFCFYYQDNLDLLSELGVDLVAFSPLEEDRLPEGVSGLILGGGYPELYLPELAGNTEMRKSVESALTGGLPCWAECGGFMYLHETVKDENGISYPMVGVLEGESFPVKRLVRFGYINLTARKDNLFGSAGHQLKGHEFHHWDSTDPGESYLAEKPVGTRSWSCVKSSFNIFAGYPHIHLYSNISAAKRFVDVCRSFAEKNSK